MKRSTPASRPCSIACSGVMSFRKLRCVCTSIHPVLLNSITFPLLSCIRSFHGHRQAGRDPPLQGEVLQNQAAVNVAQEIMLELDRKIGEAAKGLLVAPGRGAHDVGRTRRVRGREARLYTESIEENRLDVAGDVDLQDLVF